MKTLNDISKKKVQNLVIILSLSIIIITISIIILINIKKDISNYGGITFKKSMNLNNVNLIYSSDESPIQVPVPIGYVASSVESERTVNGGFVIYEGNEEVTDENLEEAKRTRNQFVWIPIENEEDMYFMSGNNIYGTYYDFTATGYVRVARLLDEPSITNFDLQSTNLTTYLNGLSQDKFLKESQQSFYKMIQSVSAYGGFYIGRYETGNLSHNEPVVVKMNTDIHSVNWYNMYKRCKKINISNRNVSTHMIWGIQFDETLKWLIDTGNKTNEEISMDSISWGNYSNATFEYTNNLEETSVKLIDTQVKIPTGSTEYTKANNIYDLAGNVWEWTMRCSDDYVFRYNRGGYYYSSGISHPCSYLNYFFDPCNGYDTLRL